jgi:uncharacterized membrane protein
MKLEVSNRELQEQNKYMEIKLNNMLLNSQWVNEEIKKKFLKT